MEKPPWAGFELLLIRNLRASRGRSEQIIDREGLSPHLSLWSHAGSAQVTQPSLSEV